MPLSEYSRPNRVGYTNSSGSSHVKVSLVTLPPGPPSSDCNATDDRICFNHGKELYVYVYRGIKKAADLTKPVDKKMYKGTNPTCHDFNTVTMTPDSISLVIGFSTGQIQLIDPIKKELSKLYNEERLIDKSKVTCIKWVPGSSNLFLAAHASGQLYVYNEELSCGATVPHYQLFKQGDGYAIHTCRTKSTRNPLYRWLIGAEGSSINEFAFSPCGTNLAVASQDGFLRVFHYDTMELIGKARSYFGGFLCVCWSPDGKYVVVGGEDDLVTVWSLSERRVVARGQGHRSWVSVVAFDPYTMSFAESENVDNSDDDRPRNDGVSCYRLGSVSQDTQLCLWDLTEDVLRPPVRARASAHLSPPCPAALSPNGIVGGKLTKCIKTNKIGHKQSEVNATTPITTNAAGETSGTLARAAGKTTKVNNVTALNITVGKANSVPSDGAGSVGVNSLTQRLAGFSFGERKEHRRNFSLTSKQGAAGGDGHRAAAAAGARGARGASGAAECCDPLRLIGTAACPRFDECPVLEPLICKKIAHERLTTLLFREECVVTACQDGCVYTWARPPPAATAHHAPDADAANLFERDRRFERIHLVD